MRRHVMVCSVLLPILAAVVACDPAGSRPPRLDYTVSVDSLACGRLHVSLVAAGLTGEEIILHGVPAYMDNPTARAKGQVVRDLVARDEAGRDLAVQPLPDTGGAPAFSVPVPAGELRVEYELVVDFEESPQTQRYPIQLPFMDTERAWLNGNYVFCYPALLPHVIESLRAPAEIRVRFDLPPRVPLVGLPRTTVRLESIYELMSLQFGLGSFWVERGTAAGREFSLVYKDSLEFDAAERAALRQRTGRLVACVIDFFGGAPYPGIAFFYFRANGIGGLEGAYTCQAYMKRGTTVVDLEEASVRSFTMVALHEFFHTWNPIAVFALEDPWFKEGITSYYEFVLAGRLGLRAPEEYAQVFDGYNQLLEDDPLMAHVALTDPRLWANEYAGDEWKAVSYARGQAVALLLDVFLREQTQNRHSLDDVMRALYRGFRLGAYTHRQLLRTIEEATGVDAHSFFADYVDGTRLPAPEQLRASLAAARQFGVFAADADPDPRD